MIQLSIILPTYQRYEKLKRAIESLQKQDTKESFELIVVDDGSEDQTKSYLEEKSRDWPTLKYISQKNSGAAAARNSGLKIAKGEIILFLDDDVYAKKDLLEKHLDFHQNHPEENLACLGYLTWIKDKEITDLMYWMTEGWKGPLMDFRHKKTGDILTFWHFYTANLSLKRSLLKETCFNEEMKGYGYEDTELAYRLEKDRNMKLLFFKEAEAEHDHFIDEAAFKKRMLQVGKAAIVFDRLHPELKVKPQGLKKLILILIGSRINLAMTKLLSKISSKFKALYWYSLSKQYFLKGSKDV